LRNDAPATTLTVGPEQTAFAIDVADLPLAPGRYLLWFRVVSLETSPPAIWDTDRVELIVGGDQRRGSIVQPRHTFRQV
jgi:hypothetical protein